MKMMYEKIFNETNCVELSVKFDWYKFSKNKNLQFICQQIIDEFEAENILASKSKARDYIKAIICNMFQNYKLDKCTSIARDKNFYSDKSNFRMKNVKRTTFLSALDFLVEREYISEIRGYKNADGTGYVSRYWSNCKLYSKFIGFKLEDVESAPQKLIVLKDEEKKLILWKGNQFTKDLRETLEFINNEYSKHEFKVELNETVSFFPRLYTVFNNRSFEQGGRAYSDFQKGLSYQSISKAERNTIRIDNEETIELDYNCLHLNLLYAEVGLQLEGDAYSFLPPEKRKLAKICTLVLLNARSEISARKSLEKKFKDENIKEAIQLCKKFHKPIKKFLGSGVGIQLQNRDSKIAISIVKKLSEQNIACLPVHDSFIVQRRFEDVLRKTMSETYTEITNFKCEISIN